MLIVRLTKVFQGQDLAAFNFGNRLEQFIFMRFSEREAVVGAAGGDHGASAVRTSFNFSPASIVT